MANGDLSASEGEKKFLKYALFRSSITIRSMEFESVHFGDDFSNPLFYSYLNLNEEALFYDSYFGVDGAIVETYFPLGILFQDSILNITLNEYGIWLDFRWDCIKEGKSDVLGYLKIRNSKFVGISIEAKYNFIYFASHDDVILENNIFEDLKYLEIERTPFIDFHPQSDCDPPDRTQNIVIKNNKF